MYSIGIVSNRFGFSRSTLLHYDKIGLLKPSGRDSSNYRVYTDDDISKLERICLYRSAGISLDQISTVINNNASITKFLDQRLSQIDDEIRILKEQKSIIVSLATTEGMSQKSGIHSITNWKNLFIKCGFNEEQLIKWHSLFEKNSPENHLHFLESLGLPYSDIILIRQVSRTKTKRKVTTHSRRKEYSKSLKSKQK
jgi:DNA-binding transcriptional MerR regulator